MIINNLLKHFADCTANEIACSSKDEQSRVAGLLYIFELRQVGEEWPKTVNSCAVKEKKEWIENKMGFILVVLVFYFIVNC